MALGPIELVIVEYPDDMLHTEVAPEIVALVEAGTIRIVDLVYICRHADGVLESIELSEADDAVQASYCGCADDFEGLLSEEDIVDLGAALAPGSSLLAVLFENTWAAKFTAASRAAGGEVIFNERIPHAVIEALTA